MLYFSKFRIILISLFTLIFVYLTSSNFIKIDDNWIIRNHDNKVILYSNDLKSMSKSFLIKFDRYSKVDKIIVSNKSGSLMKSRIYKK